MTDQATVEVQPVRGAVMGGNPLRRAAGLVVGVLVLVAGSCNPGTDPEPVEDRCIFPGNEFPPTDCARLRGTARAPDGSPLADLTLGVDSFIPSVGYAYGSDGNGHFVVQSGSSGAFEMLVLRINRLIPPASPDTASVEVKVYPNRNPKGRDPAIAATLVRMSFVPRGELIPPTVADVVFHLPQ